MCIRAIQHAACENRHVSSTRALCNTHATFMHHLCDINATHTQHEARATAFGAYTCVSAYVYMPMHVSIHVPMQTCMPMSIHMSHAYVQPHVHTHVYTHVHTHVQIYVHTHPIACLCVAAFGLHTCRYTCLHPCPCMRRVPVYKPVTSLHKFTHPSTHMYMHMPPPSQLSVKPLEPALAQTPHTRP